MGGWRRVRRSALLATTATFAVTLAWPAAAEVSTDGSVGRKVTRSSRDVTVEAGLGRRRGGNLFHSFDRFGVPTNGSVTFTGPGGIDNVVSRVTGGERSDINGELASTIPGADFYLVNPAGIVFGPNASLDVSGSFHASTADELRFGDGAVFSADLGAGGSRLSVAAPRSFGFLGERPNGIKVVGGLLDMQGDNTLSLVGGDVVFAGGRARAEAGVTLVALGGRGRVMVGTGAATGAISGEVRLDAATVAASGDGSGVVRIHGGRLVVADGARITADNRGAADATGGIRVAADTVEVRGGGTIVTSTFAGGKAGSVRIDADELLRIDGAGGNPFTGVASKAHREAMGSAGAVTVNAETVELRAGGAIVSDTAGPGNAGMVELTARSLVIEGDGATAATTIASNALGGSSGDAGNVTVWADRLVIDGAGSRTSTGIVSSALKGAEGRAGQIEVEAGDLRIRAGGLISTSTFADDAGTVRVTADRLRVDGTGAKTKTTGITSSANQGAEGNAGQVVVTAGWLSIDGAGSRAFSTGILSNGNDTGDSRSGDVSVRADDIELRAGGQISNDTSGGDAGTVKVIAGRLLIDGAASAATLTGIASRARRGASGGSGQVVVRADDLELRAGGLISSGTFARDAGTVVVAARRLLIDGAGAGFTGISSNANNVATGDAGSVTVEADAIELRDGGRISSSSFGAGSAGDVVVSAGTLFANEGVVETEGADAEGGRIKVTADDLIHLKDSEVTSNGDTTLADASLITLEAPFIVLNDSRVTSLTNGEPLSGSGEANLVGDVTVISADSLVAGSSAVEIAGLQQNLGSGLQVAPGAFLDTGRLLRASCAARGAARSSFTAGGRGGLPPAPDRPLGSLGAGATQPTSGQMGALAACGDPFTLTPRS